MDNREQRLRAGLAQVAGGYDYVLIDCPPSLNMLTLNAMVAADGVIIAMQCEYFALEGLSALVGTIQRVAETVNPKLQIEGILRTMYDPRNSLTNDVSAQLHSHFGDRVYRTVVPRNVRLAEAPSHGCRPCTTIGIPAAPAYMALAGEIIGARKNLRSWRKPARWRGIKRELGCRQKKRGLGEGWMPCWARRVAGSAGECCPI